jgi:hypothetical protein
VNQRRFADARVPNENDARDRSLKPHRFTQRM